MNRYLRMSLLPLALLAGQGVGAADRVLVMAISEYPKAPLPGAKHDADNARQIVQKLGLSRDNFRVVTDQQLSAEGIKNELNRLVNETENGDRVMIFFSGHGSSRYNNGVCEQVLVAQDRKPVTSSTIAESLNRIKDKASKVVMLVDACHSGGVVEALNSRGVASRSTSGLRAKWVESEDPRERCTTPVNIVEERVTRGTRSVRGVGVEKNYLYVAAARADEVAFDDESKGGMATSSLLECLKSGNVDTDHSGSISFQELANCAQGRIDQRFRNDPVNRPHHLTLAGNANLPLVQVADAGTVDPAATLNDLANGADSRWQVQLNSNLRRAHINRDAFRLSVTSSQDGYLYLLYVGSDRREFLQLYPDAPNAPNQVRAGQVFNIPGEFSAGGPAGKDTVLAVVSATPRNFASIFRDGSASASAGNAAALQSLTCASRKPGDECADDGTRNLKRKPQNGESGGYGAALIELIEE